MRLDSWLEASENNRRIFGEVTDEAFVNRELKRLSSFSRDLAWLAFEERLQAEGLAAPMRKATFRWWMAAASLLLILAVGFLWKSPIWRKGGMADLIQGEARLGYAIQPGGDLATLTLADGSVITLDSNANGDLGLEGKARVLNFNGALSYLSSADGDRIVFNTLNTPKGGQYRLVLSEGTKVWLNSASSLRYPATFSGDEREVELAGEAYFEVASMADKPFRVKVSEKGYVKVTGTSFNVNAYTDERNVNTTLLKGAVDVYLVGGPSVSLKPGQQALMGDRIRVFEDVNVEEAVGWKEGWFHFNRADIGTIMRQVSRWYDVEVVFEGTPSEKTFSGVVSRENDISQVLLIMERSGVRFRIEGRRIHVL